MDVLDHKKTSSSEHENHGVHLCHRCGWPFPNPHPSAKHRRAHKRVCGKVEGFKLIDSESDHTNLDSSDNEHPSDDDRRTPSPQSDKGNIKVLGGSGGMGIKSNKSEDELFSDAVTEFSDNGVSPSMEERLESVKQLDKTVGEELLHVLEESYVSKNEKTADTSQPLQGQSQPLQGPEKASEMSDSDVVGSERNQTEITKSISDIGTESVSVNEISNSDVMGSERKESVITKSISDIKTENVSVGVSSINSLEFDSSRFSESVVVSDNRTTNGDFDKQKELISSGVETDIEGKEKGDKAIDVCYAAAREVLQSEHNLENESKLEKIEGKTLGPVALQTIALEAENETSAPQTEPEFQFKLNEVNGEAAHTGIVDEVVDQEKELTKNLQSKHDVSSQVEPANFLDASVVFEVESDSAKNLIGSIHGQSDEVCDLVGGGNQDTHLLSVAEPFPAAENPDVMIGNKYKKVLKSSFPLDLGAAEEIRSEEDDKNVTIAENIQSALSSVPAAGSVNFSSSDALVDDLKKEGVSTPIDGEVDTSVPENIPSAPLSSVPAGSLDNSSSEGVSTPIDGEVATSVPENIPRSLSSVPTGTVDNSSLDALIDDLKKEGVSMPIDGEVDTFVPQNIQSSLSSNSSSNALVDELRKEGVSMLIDGEVDTSVPENIPSTFSSVPAGTIDNSSSDALVDDLKKEGVSMPIDGEVDTSVPENIQSALSSVPAGSLYNSSSDALVDELKMVVSTPIDGEVDTSVPENIQSALSTVDNSSSDAFIDDLKKEGVSTPIDGEVDTFVPENIPSALSSVPAGTLGNSSSDALVDELKKEGVSMPIDGEVDTSVPENIQSALSSVTAGTVDHSSSDALVDELKKGVSTPIDGEVDTSVPENIQSALSSVPTAGSLYNSSSDALVDDLKKEGVSTSIDGEVDTSVSENIPGAHSSVPAGSLDNSSSDTLVDDHKKEGVSTPIDGEADTSVPENIPGALSVVPAGTVDNSSSDALIDEVKKESVSTPIDGEVDTSVPENIPSALLSVPTGTVDNSSSVALVDSTPIDGEVDTSVSENIPSAASSVPAGTVDNSSLDGLVDDLKIEATPLDEEVGACVFRVTHNEDAHLLSAAKTLHAVENPEVMIGDFKDYKVLKSSFPFDLGVAEKIRYVEGDKKVIDPENLPSAPSSVPAGTVDNSSDSSLEDDLKKEVVSIPIDGEVGTTRFRVTGDADFGSSSLGGHPKTSGFETNSGQCINNLEGSLAQSVDGKSLHNEDSETTTREHSDMMPPSVDGKPLQNEVSELTTGEQSEVIPLGSSTGEQTWETTNLHGGESAADNEIDKLVCVATENGNMQAGDKLSANITTALAHVDVVPENIEKSISSAGDDSLGHENFRMGFSNNAGNEAVEVAAEEKLVKHADATDKSVQELPNSANLDEARGSNQVDTDARNSEKLHNSSESPKYPDEIPNALDGLKTGDVTEVPRSSGTPDMVCELKCEDQIEPSEKTPENSSSKETSALPMDSECSNKNSASVEDMNIRDAIVLGPVLDGNDKVIKQNLSNSAVDDSVVSSSRTDSLDGNWGSVSVLSTQSDVTTVTDTEVLLSTDAKAAAKLDGDFKPQAAAAECHPDKSDVFEPPSFMTLVESGVVVNKNASASEIQTAQRDEQTKSEALQAAWFPSLTNVVNESEGRKKNEEIIAKVTNWSTGKQHSPLKNLLIEAHTETKVQSPNTKQVPAVNQADEIASKNSGTAVTTVSSILGSEMPSAETVKKEMEKEWNSPARYPIQIKKEKRKSKPYWVPFACCTSVHQDV